MKDFQTKDNVASAPDSNIITNYGANEHNTLAEECKNVVESTGETLDAQVVLPGSEDRTMLAKATAMYGAGGAAWHIDTGAVNAYILNPVSIMESPYQYFDGFAISFDAGVINTGPSVVTVNGMASKKILDISGNLLAGGEVGDNTIMRYDPSADSAAGAFLIISVAPFLTFNSVADLEASTYTPYHGQTVSLTGYYAVGDGGGQTLVWDASETASDNGITIFDPATVGAGRWISRDVQGLNLRQGGCYGDGTTDDWLRMLLINAAMAIANQPVIVPEGTFRNAAGNIDATVPWIFESGGSILADTKTFKISHSITADPTQTIFTWSGSGSIAGDRTVGPNTSVNTTGISSIYAAWFGVQQQNTTTDDSVKLQMAINVSQDLACYLEMPQNGRVYLDKQVVFKQGRVDSGTPADRLVYDVLLHGNNCQILDYNTGNLFLIEPECLYTDRGSGDGSSAIEIDNLRFSDQVGGSGGAITMGKDGYWIEGINGRIGLWENVTFEGYDGTACASAIKIYNTHRCEFDRVSSLDASTGTGVGIEIFAVNTVVQSHTGAFCGGLTFNNCEFGGTDDSHTSIHMQAEGNGNTDNTRAGIAGVRFNDCVIYGTDTTLRADSYGRIMDTWFQNCAWDFPSATPGQTCIVFDSVDTQPSAGGNNPGAFSQVIIDQGYFVGNLTQANTFIDITGMENTVVDDIRITNCRFSQSGTGTFQAIRVLDMENVQITGNKFFNNLCTNEIYVNNVATNGVNNHILVKDNDTSSTSITNFMRIEVPSGYTTNNLYAVNNNMITGKTITQTGLGTFGSDTDIADASNTIMTS